MKRLLLISLIVLVAASLAPAQAIDFADLQLGFQDFATAVAGTLASTASSAGLAWAPAYIGQFPHFGVGASVGASLIPFEAVKPLFTLLDVTLPAGMELMTTWGVPLPAAAVDARIGGFVLPFDIGLKFGYIPPEMKDMMGDVQVDYVMAGADIRIALLKDQGMSPALSVGVGYTYFKGAIGLTGVVPATSVDIHPLMMASGYTAGTVDTLDFSAPDLTFDWQSNVIEARAQLSKKLLIFTPNIGMSAAYGISKAGGGLSSTLTYNGDGGYSMTDVQAAFAAQGETAPTSQGINVSAAADGWSFRAFGGVGISLLFINLDLSASYNVLTGSLGGGANVRLQL